MSHMTGSKLEWLETFVSSYTADGPCVEWPFSLQHGYGVFVHEGETIRATRYVLERVAGPPPTPKHEAAHGPCHNRACVRHLRWATRAENQADRQADGTRNNGEENGFSKLTEAQVLDIFHSVGPQSEMAAKYGITQGTVSSIRLGNSWGWLTNPSHHAI